MIIGTAGHVDHGKSALVAALTGHRMDRLAEERQRGITIDLGFAPFPLGDGKVAGVVDVPGHEDLVRTMVAGASGIDLALLVIAADEGIMPQTLEHLLVLEQLGVPAGIPVITKTDLAEPDWLELVALDIAERLATSPVRFEEPARVSARTGEGVSELRARIQDRLLAVPQRERDDLFRLPVDRVFSIAGIGTVITGTCWSGTIGIGDAIRILPAAAGGRVRSSETHGEPSAVQPGARTAIGIAGIDRDSISRGDLAVGAEAAWSPSRSVDVMLRLDASAPKALGRRQRVRLLLGTGEWIGWASPRAPVAPGRSGLARVTLDRDIVARGGDRFVLRSLSPVRTVGGGEVIDPAPPARGARLPDSIAGASVEDRMVSLIGRRRHGVPTALLPVLLGRSPRECLRIVDSESRLARAAGHAVLRETVLSLADRAAAAVAAFHAAHVAERGMPLQTLRQGLRVPEWLADQVIEHLVGIGAVTQRDGMVSGQGFRPSGAGGSDQVDAVVAALAAAGLTPPTVAELAVQLGTPDVAASLRAAAAAGRADPVERDRYFARSVLNDFVVLLEGIAAAGPFTVGAVRDRTGLSRKFLIPLLEWSDARGWTIRQGDLRRFRAGRSAAGATAPASAGSG